MWEVKFCIKNIRCIGAIKILFIMLDVFTLNNHCVDKLEISMVIAVAIHKAVVAPKAVATTADMISTPRKAATT